jgi:uncharacterized damage-inducible protein DinB
MSKASPAPPEVWLRGPLEGVPPLLQPVGHALLQAEEEVIAMMEDFDQSQLGVQPAGVASIGFHLRHLTGVLDRLFTYARAEPLSPEQLNYLEAEGVTMGKEESTDELVNAFRRQVSQALDQLKQTRETTLTEPRGVGRAQLPSTVMGLLFHAAEHTMRHVGQLHVTVRMLQST